jgi:hypothetical protein
MTRPERLYAPGPREMRNAYNVSMDSCKEKGQLQRSRYGWARNFKINRKGNSCGLVSA